VWETLSSLAGVVKLVFSLRRRREMTREELQAYWRDHRAPLVDLERSPLRIGEEHAVVERA
jgi:hypothetical protein